MELSDSDNPINHEETCLRCGCEFIGQFSKECPKCGFDPEFEFSEHEKL